MTRMHQDITCCSVSSLLLQRTPLVLEPNAWKHTRRVLREGDDGNATSLPAPRSFLTIGMVASSASPSVAPSAVELPAQPPAHEGTGLKHDKPHSRRRSDGTSGSMTPLQRRLNAPRGWAKPRKSFNPNVRPATMP